MRLGVRTIAWTCAVVGAVTIALPATAAENTATARARGRLEAAKAAEDANPTKANALAVDRALAELNAAAATSTLRRITAPATISESEDNNTAATADALDFGSNPGATASATIIPAGDVDYFSFTAPANARLWGYVDTGGAQIAPANSRDSILRFVTNDGVSDILIEEDDDDGTGNGLDGSVETELSSSLAGVPGPPGGGTVYARIAAVDALPLDQTINPMTLYVVTTTSATAEEEVNDTAVTANVLFSGVPHVGVRTGEIPEADPDDEDFYSVTAKNGDVLYLALDGDPERDGSTGLELSLISTDGTTVLLAANSDNDSPLTEAFAFQVTSTGTFFVRVRDEPLDTDFGTYAVMVANITQNVPAEDTIGIRDSNNNFFLRNANSNGPADVVFTFGVNTDVPLAGDWNNDGTDTIGVYRPSTGEFFLRDSNSTGPADAVFTFGGGGAGIVPITGDWDGNGSDTIGLYIQSSGVFFLRNTNSNGPADLTFTYGGPDPDYRPLTGDWDGDGDDTIGLYVQDTGVFFLRSTNSNGPADLTFTYGAPDPNYRAIDGDWDGEGTDTIGLYNFANGIVFLRNTNSNGSANVTFQYGAGGATPLAGDWDDQP